MKQRDEKTQLPADLFAMNKDADKLSPANPKPMGQEEQK